MNWWPKYDRLTSHHPPTKWEEVRPNRLSEPRRHAPFSRFSATFRRFIVVFILYSLMNKPVHNSLDSHGESIPIFFTSSAFMFRESLVPSSIAPCQHLHSHRPYAQISGKSDIVSRFESKCHSSEACVRPDRSLGKSYPSLTASICSGYRALTRDDPTCQRWTILSHLRYQILSNLYMGHQLRSINLYLCVLHAS